MTTDLQQFLGDSNDNTSNDADDDTGTFAPNETTGLYYTVGDLQAVVGAVCEAGGIDITSKPAEDAHPMTRYWAAIHALKGDMGQRQRDENPFALKDENEAGETYAETFGPSGFPSVDTDTLTSGERRTLSEQGVDVDGLGEAGEPQIPEPTGHPRLPIHVGDEEDLAEAIKALEALPDEPAAMGDVGSEEGGEEEGTQGEGESGDGPETETCPHCGDEFDPRGIGPHKAACDGKADVNPSEDDEGGNGAQDVSKDELREAAETILAALD